MTNTFWQKTKEIISEFVTETRESLDWAATEIRKQYYISALKDLTKEYPVTALKTNSLLYFLDHENYKLEEMQFGMVPDPLYDAIKAIKNPDKNCPDFVEPPDTTYFRVVAKGTQGNSAASPVNKFENGVVTTISNSIIVWDSGFTDTQLSVGVVITKDGNSYRVVDGFSGKLDITEQLDVITKLSSQYPDAVVGILNKANGAALFHLLQSKIPNIQQIETYFSEGTRLENIKKEGRLLFDFGYDEEREIAINYGVEYLYNQSLNSFTDVDLTDLKQGDYLSNRFGAPEFETEAETDAFKFVEMKQNISDDGLNEPRYPYDTEPSA
jgi:hypothetical protein